ncbi:MAG: aminopeptidase P family N-terminal domain-containing protein, partial [Anaerolineales bacterium]
MTNLTSIKISKEEYQTRVDLLHKYLQEEKLSGIVLFDRDYILYYTGFSFIPTERPMAFLMNQK